MAPARRTALTLPTPPGGRRAPLRWSCVIARARPRVVVAAARRAPVRPKAEDRPACAGSACASDWLRRAGSTQSHVLSPVTLRVGPPAWSRSHRSILRLRDLGSTGGLRHGMWRLPPVGPLASSRACRSNAFVISLVVLLSFCARIEGGSAPWDWDCISSPICPWIRGRYSLGDGTRYYSRRSRCLPAKRLEGTVRIRVRPRVRSIQAKD